MYYIKQTDKPNFDYSLDIIESSLQKGIRVSQDIAKISARYDEELKEHHLKLVRDYNINNPNSSKQVQDYFINSMNEEDFIFLKKTKTGFSFDKDVLADLATVGYTAAESIIKFRQLSKIQSTLEMVNKFIDDDGFVRPKLNTQKSNRISYTDPGLMTIHKETLWEVIKPRNDGDRLFSVDISYQEPWIAVHMFNVNTVKQLMMEHPDMSLYDVVFMAVFNSKPANEIEHNEIKTAWNALTYGGTTYTIDKCCKHIDGREIIRFFKSNKEYSDFIGKCYGMAKKNTTSLTTYFGTRVQDDGFKKGSALARTLMSLPVQGTAADILALLIEHFDKTINNMRLDEACEFYMSRHDELIINVMDKIGPSENIIWFLKDTLEHQVEDWSPFRIKIKQLGEAF